MMDEKDDLDGCELDFSLTTTSDEDIAWTALFQEGESEAKAAEWKELFDA